MPAPPPAQHLFSDPSEIEDLRGNLLAWYDKSKRDLPWRTLVRGEAAGGAVVGSRTICLKGVLLR